LGSNAEIQGEGWYDSDTLAPFSVDSPSLILYLQSFDLWNRDISQDLLTSTHGALVMKGPKDISATWKWDIKFHIIIWSTI